MRNTARGLGLFWDFTQSISAEAKQWDVVDLHRTLLRCFAQALISGTIDSKSHIDRLQLYWPPIGIKRARSLTNSIQEFVTWVAIESADSTGVFGRASIAKLSKVDQNALPIDAQTTTRFLIVAKTIKNLSMMHHLKDEYADADSLNLKRRDALFEHTRDAAEHFNIEPAMHMDPNLVSAMLRYGFVKNEHGNAPEIREDITAKMIFILLAFGGLRNSEPFHIWFNDVRPNETDGTCHVQLRHPSQSKTYIHGEQFTRLEYLKARGLTPRNYSKDNVSYFAGWKYLAVDRTLSAPVFFIHDGAEALFGSLYTYYLDYRKRLLQMRRQRGLSDHPFLFVSSGEDRHTDTSYRGNPYSMPAFRKAFYRALDRVEKITNQKIPRGKDFGTTPHALRHLYGRLLSDAGVNQKVIQKCLHHRSVLSQSVYTVPTRNKISEELTHARRRISLREGGKTDFNPGPWAADPFRDDKLSVLVPWRN